MNMHEINAMRDGETVPMPSAMEIAGKLWTLFGENGLSGEVDVTLNGVRSVSWVGDHNDNQVWVVLQDKNLDETRTQMRLALEEFPIRQIRGESTFEYLRRVEAWSMFTRRRVLGLDLHTAAAQRLAKDLGDDFPPSHEPKKSQPQTGDDT